MEYQVKYYFFEMQNSVTKLKVIFTDASSGKNDKRILLFLFL